MFASELRILDTYTFLTLLKARTYIKTVIFNICTMGRLAMPANGRIKIWLNRRFLRLWALTFIFLTLLSYSLGLAPQNIAADASDLAAEFLASTKFLAGADAGTSLTSSENYPDAATAQQDTADEGESRIIIPTISVNAPIIMPANTSLAVLNDALPQGVVHYPPSAMPGRKGNVLLFGHSTGFKVVHNQNYAVFNRLQELEAGNIIRLRAGAREYWYRVLSVSVKKAEEAVIVFDTDRRLLTLSTCRVFGAKEDRFVVEAEFMRSYPLRSLASAADSSS